MSRTIFRGMERERFGSNAPGFFGAVRRGDTRGYHAGITPVGWFTRLIAWVKGLFA